MLLAAMTHVCCEQSMLAAEHASCEEPCRVDDVLVV
jgi:hypothetical protein